MSETTEFAYLDGQEISDVLFVVEGQRLPAVKAFLSEKSIVFSDMFSEDFREGKEIVIEDTTYMAFRAFLMFLFGDYLVLDIDKDIKMIGELYRLSQRYDVSRLADRILDEFTKRYFSDLSALRCESNEDFQQKWLTFGPIARLAIEWQFIRLMEKVMVFIEINSKYFWRKHNKEVIQLNEWFDGRLIEFMLMKAYCKIQRKDHRYLRRVQIPRNVK